MTPHSLVQGYRVFTQCNKCLQRFTFCQDITASVSAPASLHIRLTISTGNQTTCIIILGFLTPEEGTDRLSRNVGKELLLLLSSSSSSSSLSSPLCRVFILIFLRQTMPLGNTVLQLFCCYYSWCLYRYFQC